MVWKKFGQTNEKGQAVIEFLLGLMIVISFFFFYIRMSAVFAISNYIHYATFMAARTLSSSAGSQDTQQSSAQAVMQQMVLGKFKTMVTPVGQPNIGPGDFYQNDPLLDNWNQGVSYTFKSKLSLYPWNKAGQSIDLELTSNSWMPREETTDDCATKKGKIKGILAGNQVVVGGDIEWDNGGANGC